MKIAVSIGVILWLFLPLLSSSQDQGQKSGVLTHMKVQAQKWSLLDSNLVSFFNNAQTRSMLNYPSTSERFYQHRNFRMAWFGAGGDRELVYTGMKMLARASKYGLDIRSFHPEKLNRRKIDSLTSGAPKVLYAQQTDVFLTDALITFLIQLHHGFANPYISYHKLDSDSLGFFRAENILSEALNDDLESRIFSVQPLNPGYRELQRFMQGVAEIGRDGSTYADTARLVALNLERYRWQNIAEPVYVEINIPSFTLFFRQTQRVDTFRVIVGTPANPTPVLISSIDHFDTAPDWNVPGRIFRRELLPKILRDPGYLERNKFAIYDAKGTYIVPVEKNLTLIRANPAAYHLKQSFGCDNALGQIVFRFANPYGVYLHDTPQKHLFEASSRAFSHGCIRLESPKELAYMLLKARNISEDVSKRVSLAMDRYQRLSYYFQPVPIVVRYITCAVHQGQLIVYKDLYAIDGSEIQRLFNLK